ncbi:MAG TPA: hypothetical protein VIZ21_07100 [Ignavibacteriaceae bacterium]
MTPNSKVRLYSDLIFGLGLTVMPPVEVEVNASAMVGALNPVPKDDLKISSFESL